MVLAEHRKQRLTNRPTDRHRAANVYYMAGIWPASSEQKRMPTTTSIIPDFDARTCACVCVYVHKYAQLVHSLIQSFIHSVFFLVHIISRPSISLLCHTFCILYSRAFRKMHKRFVSLIDFGLQHSLLKRIRTPLN